MKALVIILMLGVAAAGTPSAADSIADFYSGKRMQMIIRDTAGSGYDLYARLLARHIVRHIPGNPTIVSVNMPGGGGIVAANYVANVAPRDGSILSMVSQGLPLDQALKLSNTLKADVRELNWIGNMSDSNQVLVTWHTSQTKTLEDAKRRETLVSATGPSASSAILPTVYNKVLGAKFKVVYGYPGVSDLDLAMERGEVDGRGTNSWAAYVGTTHYVRDKLLNVIIQVGIRKDKDLPDVPLLSELGKNPEEKAILDFVTKTIAVGRPIATTPGVPTERVAALRKAFDQTVIDMEFIKDADLQHLDIGPMSGIELTKLINDIVGSPDSILERAKSAMEVDR